MTMASRKSEIRRKTKETDVTLSLSLDGSGAGAISTGVGFLDHMLDLLARHGLLDLTVNAKGDTHVDAHHTVEDVGICLGQALKEALGDRKGIRRFGDCAVPMEDALAQVALDLGGRGALVFNVAFPTDKTGDFDVVLVEEFFRAVAGNAGMNLHVNVPYGRNSHHVAEAVFKSFARALDQAMTRDPRIKGVPSTKGVL
jgi:imidazoleglycerol-phosphate dehydratase